MRIYNRKDFIKLPDGTISCKVTKWSFDNLSTKGHSWDNDFLYVDLCNIDAKDRKTDLEFMIDVMKISIQTVTVPDGGVTVYKEEIT